MNSEYVRFLRPEVTYGKKNLLKSQINVLNLSKDFVKFRELRKEEFLLKVALKIKLEEVKNSLKLLESQLPKPKMLTGSLKELEAQEKEKKKFKTIEQEIESLKKVIETLQ